MESSVSTREALRKATRKPDGATQPALDHKYLVDPRICGWIHVLKSDETWIGFFLSASKQWYAVWCSVIWSVGVQC